jgi:two-component system chemotaxis response regulator CheY
MAKIFIVDDDQSLQRLYTLILADAGFEIIGTAFNGKSAIEKYNNLTEKPDIVLMDHRMPVRNGLDAMVEMLRINKDLKIIFASADNSIKQKALKLGACAFLDKPFNIRKLLALIQKICEEIVLEN